MLNYRDLNIFRKKNFKKGDTPYVCGKLCNNSDHIVTSKLKRHATKEKSGIGNIISTALIKTSEWGKLD